MFKFSRPRYADIMSTLAVVMVIGGGTAYAAATLTGADIVDESLTGVDVQGKAGTSTVAAVNGSLTGADISGQPANVALNQPAVNGSLTTYDIADGNVKAVDIAANAVNSARVADNTLTGADINESTLGVVQGSGKLLTNRIVTTPGVLNRVVLDIPGLGFLRAGCDATLAYVEYVNNTGGPVDVWTADSINDSADLMPHDSSRFVAYDGSSSQPGGSAATLSLGVGNDPGARRVATLRISALQTADGSPCGFQAQGTVWRTP